MGVLVTLKNSARNSSLLDSLNRNSLWMLRSPVAQARTPDRAHAASSERAGNGWGIGGGIEPLEADELPAGRIQSGFSPKHVGGATQLARDPRELVPEASSATIVSGNPPRNWTIPPNCQFAITALTTGFKFFPISVCGRWEVHKPRSLRGYG